MAFDEGLAERLRGIFAGQMDVAEKKMFGGLAFMVRGSMCVGVTGDELMARVGPDQYDEALTLPHARHMHFTGKRMKGCGKRGKGRAADGRKAAMGRASSAARMPGRFVKGTSLKDGVGKTRAKPAIWVKWADFEAASGKLKAAGANLATAAAGGDAAAIKMAAGAIGKSCGGCHKPFRGPKPKKQ